MNGFMAKSARSPADSAGSWPAGHDSRQRLAKAPVTHARAKYSVNLADRQRQHCENSSGGDPAAAALLTSEQDLNDFDRFQTEALASQRDIIGQSGCG